MNSIPHYADARWLDAEWRTATFLALCEQNGLEIETICAITGTQKSTVYCWRASVDRPITALHLRVLMFEMERGADVV